MKSAHRQLGSARTRQPRNGHHESDRQTMPDPTTPAPTTEALSDRLRRALTPKTARRALAERNITTVYRLLTQVDISQRQIAQLTGQSQSEVSEVIKGRRVMAYDVLLRIAQGLDVPRAW